MFTKVKTPQEIADMRTSGKILAQVLNSLAKQVKAGMSTLDIAQLTKKELQPTGGKAAFLGYQGYPDIICVSVNDEIVHGIPRKNHLIFEGDLVSLDFGVSYNGMITDSAISIIVGKSSDELEELLKTTKEALYAGIKKVKNGINVGDISSAVERVLAPAGYGIVRDMVGHGVGHQIHELPNIPNYGRPHTGPKLTSGMTIAIEPMATLGDYRISIDADGWTTRTVDGSIAAHFEHTVLITENGSEILTTLN